MKWGLKEFVFIAFIFIINAFVREYIDDKVIRAVVHAGMLVILYVLAYVVKIDEVFARTLKKKK